MLSPSYNMLNHDWDAIYEIMGAKQNSRMLNYNFEVAIWKF